MRVPSRFVPTVAILCAAAFASSARAQQPAAAPPRADTVVAIAPPRAPLPAEAASADVTRFSYIVYGDTRGRRDGIDPQYEHSLIVDGMLRVILNSSWTERERGSPFEVFASASDTVRIPLPRR